MDNKVQEFLAHHRVSVLGVLQVGQRIHSAALHYVHTDNPLTFYLSTYKESMKCKSLHDGKEHSASLVIGFNEEEFVTYQAEGMVQIIEREEEIEKAKEIYVAKYPDRKERLSSDGTAMLKFTPTFWKHSDYKVSPAEVVSSE